LHGACRQLSSSGGAKRISASGESEFLRKWGELKETVTSAKVGIQKKQAFSGIPAFAGMTKSPT